MNKEKEQKIELTRELSLHAQLSKSKSNEVEPMIDIQIQESNEINFKSIDLPIDKELMSDINDSTLFGPIKFNYLNWKSAINSIDVD